MIPLFKVLDKHGIEWSRYRYFGMARDVAERCMYDKALAARAPFRVAPPAVNITQACDLARVALRAADAARAAARITLDPRQCDVADELTADALDAIDAAVNTAYDLHVLITQQEITP